MPAGDAELVRLDGSVTTLNEAVARAAADGKVTVILLPIFSSQKKLFPPFFLQAVLLNFGSIT